MRTPSSPGADAPQARPADERVRVDATRPIAPSPPNQFQRFVQEATGRLLPIYGSELFQGSAPYQVDASLPAPADYVLGVGDEVRLQVWGSLDYAGAHVIDRNGQINLPRVGVVTLAGVPLAELEALLKSRLSRVFVNFSLSASMGRLRSVQVYVVGQAQQPGSYQLPSLSTLVHAVFASGGPNSSGSMRNIQLRRGGQTVSTLDLYEFIGKGDRARDVQLLAGDVIVVAPAGPRVAITGALDQAAIYELKPGGDELGSLLDKVGGVPALADPRKAVLERVLNDQVPPRRVFDLSLDSLGLKTALRDGDLIRVLPVSPAFANAVTLQGTVAQSMRYRWFEGMRLLDLIPDREALITPGYHNRRNLLVQTLQSPGSGAKMIDRVSRLADDINWDYAVVERMDSERLNTTILPFHLGRLVLGRDSTENLALMPGDVVTIFSNNDLKLPVARRSRLVRLEGEVAAPGIYQARPGETIAQLITRVGGLTPQAYLFGAEFSRESVRQRQQENLDGLIRRLEAQSLSQLTTQLSNSAGDRAQAQALQAAQQAQLRAQIERLRELKSSGRVALEIDPRLRDVGGLPAIALEDGDRIMVPSLPGFVAAMGSVNNENVFVYRPGKTVGEVLSSAGLTEDAEPDQAFVLRADGSIVARRDRGGWWPSSGRFESLEVMPGDTVVVPAMLDRESRYNFFIRAAKDWTQILSNFGLGVAALKTLRN